MKRKLTIRIILVIIVTYPLFLCIEKGYKNPKIFGYVLDSITLKPIDSVIVKDGNLEALTNEIGYVEFPRGKKTRGWKPPFMEATIYPIHLVLLKDSYINDTFYFKVWVDQEELNFDTLYLKKK
jgi:hypothetical protein